MAESAKTDQPSAATPPAQPPQIRLDDSHAVCCYANFCRVTGTPEELIVDFALNNHPMEAPEHPIPIAQRIVLNHFTAKRLLAALHMSIQRHEAAFGVLETDVRKRVEANAAAAGQSQS